jgi:hypothetical protein
MFDGVLYHELVCLQRLPKILVRHGNCNEMSFTEEHEINAKHLAHPLAFSGKPFLLQKRIMRRANEHQAALQLTQMVNAEPVLRRLSRKGTRSLAVSSGWHWGTLRLRCSGRTLPATAASMPATGGQRRALKVLVNEIVTYDSMQMIADLPAIELNLSWDSRKSADLVCIDVSRCY